MRNRHGGQASWRGFGLVALGAGVLAAIVWPSLPAWGAAEGGGVERAGYPERASFGQMVGPCADPGLRSELKCPDLKMRKPFDLYFDYSPNGRLLLHAANDVQSRGSGPLEIRGRKTMPDRPNRMQAHQVIYKRGGGKLHRKPSGYVVFYPIPYQGRYWKYANAARFEVWKLDSDRQPVRRVRTGPKADYCLRDLEHTMPSDRSPSYPVYPGCSQDREISKVTLGISVGWSDVYPAQYYENLVDATGLKGCYLLREIADPLNQISELRENNNVGVRRVRLTGSPTSIRSC